MNEPRNLETAKKEAVILLTEIKSRMQDENSMSDDSDPPFSWVEKNLKYHLKRHGNQLRVRSKDCYNEVITSILKQDVAVYLHPLIDRLNFIAKFNEVNWLVSISKKRTVITAYPPDNNSESPGDYLGHFNLLKAAEIDAAEERAYNGLTEEEIKSFEKY